MYIFRLKQLIPILPFQSYSSPALKQTDNNQELALNLLTQSPHLLKVATDTSSQSTPPDIDEKVLQSIDNNHYGYLLTLLSYSLDQTN